MRCVSIKTESVELILVDCEKHLQYVCYSCDSITKVNKISQTTNTPRDIVIYKVWSSREWRVLDVLVSEWCSSGDDMKKPEMERDDFVSEGCRYNARQKKCGWAVLGVLLIRIFFC